MLQQSAREDLHWRLVYPLPVDNYPLATLSLPCPLYNIGSHSMLVSEYMLWTNAVGVSRHLVVLIDLGEKGQIHQPETQPVH